MGATDENKRRKRVLAKPLSYRGAMRGAGETVELRPDQIARLEPQGYLKPEGDTGRKGDSK